MKPCEFPGWVELEDDDIAKSGDPLVDRHYTPDHPADTVYGYHGWPKKKIVGYRVFRFAENAKAVPVKRVLNAHFSKPLPLP